MFKDVEGVHHSVISNSPPWYTCGFLNYNKVWPNGLNWWFQFSQVKHSSEQHKLSQFWQFFQLTFENLRVFNPFFHFLTKSSLFGSGQCLLTCRLETDFDLGIMRFISQQVTGTTNNGLPTQTETNLMLRTCSERSNGDNINLYNWFSFWSKVMLWLEIRLG